MPSRSDGEPKNAIPVSFFQKLASGVPGILFTYWLSPDGQSHRYPYVSDQVQDLFGVEPTRLKEMPEQYSR